MNDKLKDNFDTGDFDDNMLKQMGVTPERFADIARLVQHSLIDYTADVIKSRFDFLNDVIEKVKPVSDYERYLTGIAFGMCVASMMQNYEQNKMKEAIMNHTQHQENPFRMQPKRKIHES